MIKRFIVFPMKCCIIGCGASGIIAAKHLKQQGIDFDAFERTNDVGGTWIYTEQDADKHGSIFHTAMYKNLRTNLPKEVMGFEGFKYDTTESYLSSNRVLQYLKKFVSHHNLMDHIKLGHNVLKVHRNENKWEITVKNVENKEYQIHLYDAVIVCNGHFYKTRFPKIDGMNEFKGMQMHSKHYRTPDIFKDKKLLVIGYGPSGQDITIDASKQAKTVFLSHHAKKFNAESFPNNVVSKPDVKSLDLNSVTFVDGSTETIDSILYCTGYYYDYPFLDDSCGILVDDNYVRPLYKQIINIKYPSMAFIGLNFTTFLLPLFEIQVKAFLKTLQNPENLPSEQEMMEELKRFEETKVKEGKPKRKYHQLTSVRDHIADVRSLGNLPDISPVLYKIYDHNLEQRSNNLGLYRNYVYQIIDNEKFNVFYKERK